MALVLGTWFARRGDGVTARQPVRVPWFIGGFILLSALFTVFPQWQPVAHGVTVVARALLTLTLFCIGAGLDRRAIRTVGARPFVHGLLLWIPIASATPAALLAGWIR